MATHPGSDVKPVDVKSLFALLESSDIQAAEDIKKLILENTKDSWLLTGLVDYFYASNSVRARDLLVQIKEPHTKNVIDKIHDGVKSSENKLQALTLLLHLMCSQPSWLKKIVSGNLFSCILKCLKTETDVPCLMTSVLIITILLPSVPTLIGNHLMDIFDIFCRLCTFSIKKPGNVPDIFLLHLQVGVYALFHRLYGMYPWHLLEYLRGYCQKKENIRVYEEVIKRMLERVRIHPQFVTGNKDSEMSTSRWKKLEPHDVIAECSKMSVDPVEGSIEGVRCPFISVSNQTFSSAGDKESDPQPYSPLANESGVFNYSNKFSVEFSPQTYNSIQDSNTSLWSPSVIVGLSTPPHSQRTTPAASMLETSFASIPVSQQGTCGNTPIMTPEYTPRETPPITDSTERNTAHASSHHGLMRTNDPKRLSLGLQSKTSVSTTPNSLDNRGMSLSVPPSPLKPEFTSEPPIGVVRAKPTFPAARELRFEMPDRERLDASSLQVKMSTDIHHGRQEAVKQHGEHEEKVNGDGSMASLSLATLRNVPVLEETPDDCTDQEVSDLTQDSDLPQDGQDTDSTSQTHLEPQLTAESVMQFMKKVNRIRFNSLTAENNSEKSNQDRSLSTVRSRSCPQLKKLDTMSEEDDGHAMRSVSMNFSGQEKDCISEGLKNTECSDVGAAGAETEPTGVHNQSKEKAFCKKCPYLHSPTSDSLAQKEIFRMFQMLVFPPKLVCCKNCNKITDEESEEGQGLSPPVLNPFSPPQLLDRHLIMGGDLHAQELGRVPITSSGTINWTHFGGTPPADEVNILRSQIHLIHNQLMYERNKRDQHAKRNRRLLRKIASCNASEEQNSALTDQLKIKETEIQNLHVSLKLLQNENRQLTSDRDSTDYQEKVQLRTCLQRNEDLGVTNTELKSLLITQKEEHDKVKKVLQEAESKLFHAEKEIEHMKEKVELAEKMKDQILHLQKEKLLMGELQQKYEEKLKAMKINSNFKLDENYRIESQKADLRVARQLCEEKNVQLEGYSAKLFHLEEANKRKEAELSDLKKKFEDSKSGHNEEIRAIEEKYKSTVKITQQLQGDVLHLYSLLDQCNKNHKPTKKGFNKPTNKPAEDEDHHSEEKRERTHSDPPEPKVVQKEPLSRIKSVPAQALSCTQKSTQTCEKDQTKSTEVVSTTSDSANLPSVISDIAARKRVGEACRGSTESNTDSDQLDNVFIRSGQVDSASVSSHDATGNGLLLYTDSDDSQSMSSTSHKLSDSGYGP